MTRKEFVSECQRVDICNERDAPMTSLSRRRFLINAVQLPIAGSLAVSMFGCGARNDLNCIEADVMNPANVLARKSRDYVEHSPHADKSCSNCALFGSNGPDSCGICTLDSLPANPSGYCSSWRS